MSEAIRKQAWFVVVIEVLVVVVGIFIGLQVDDWNQSRKDRIDEQLFLEQLHGDILLAEALSARLLSRRLGRQELHIAASDILFGRTDRDTLSEEECSATAATSHFNIVAASLPSFLELAGTGRLHIIQDAQLRSALVSLEQIRGALIDLISIQTIKSINLPRSYPDLIQLAARNVAEVGEVASRATCDTDGMRENQAFLSDFSDGIDIYDAYVRDGLRPWATQFDRVHQLVDDALGLRHENE
jgi:hypothetical protein